MVTKGLESVPGVGEYTIPSKISEGPKIGIHEKVDTFEPKVKRGVPGPGEYDL